MASAREEPAEHVPELTPLLPAASALDILEQRHVVLRLLNTLPSRQRQVLAWTLDGYSSTEVAAELAMKSAAVRANLKQARRALATLLQHERRNS